MNRSVYVTIVSEGQELRGERERCREGVASAGNTISIGPFGVGHVSDVPIPREAQGLSSPVAHVAPRLRGYPKSRADVTQGKSYG